MCLPIVHENQQSIAGRTRARFLLHRWYRSSHRPCADRSDKERMMHPLMSALLGLAPDHDPELDEGFQRYVAYLETILTPAQLDTYTTLIQRTGTVQIFEELTPDELAALTADELVIATTIMADETGTMENRRVAALLSQRGAA